jgi:hypothetical protein
VTLFGDVPLEAVDLAEPLERQAWEWMQVRLAWTSGLEP